MGDDGITSDLGGCAEQNSGCEGIGRLRAEGEHEGTRRREGTEHHQILER